MTRARTVALLLAAVALSAASPLAQAAATTTLLEVAYGLGPTANDDMAGRDNHPDVWFEDDPVHRDLWHCNSGAGTWLRIKGWQHMYHADWDTYPMIADVDVGGQLTGWGSYIPIYSLSIMPIVGGDWPITPVPIHISCVWSENDWFEGDGPNTFANYNWSNPVVDYAATYMYAGDTLIPGMEIPWIFPGGGTGANAPYPRDVDCTFLGTFLTHGDVREDDWEAWNGEPKTPTNSQSFSIGTDNFPVNDNGTPLDPSDDFYDEIYVEVQLDQAIIDDMLLNPYNRGLTLWNLDDWDNKYIYSADQNPGTWPYIHARIDVCDGDGNLDQEIDGLDYVIWSNNYWAPHMGWGGGDWNNDGMTDGLDYVIWSNNYMQACPAAPGAVPEPATLSLVAIGALALMRRRRR